MTAPERSGERERLDRAVARQVERFERARRERSGVIAQSAYVGVLGLLFVLPVVGGAFLGRWLDSLATGYSIRWTVSLILIGVAIGAANVYFFVRE
jgi:ATP synthase protein I